MKMPQDHQPLRLGQSRIVGEKSVSQTRRTHHSVELDSYAHNDRIAPALITRKRRKTFVKEYHTMAMMCDLQFDNDQNRLAAKCLTETGQSSQST